MHRYWIYVLTNPSRTLYIGVTSNLAQRVHQHRNGDVPGFTRRYRVKTLVYAEEFSDVWEALAREKQLKKWRRSKKIELIERLNPKWEDLGKEGVL
jgi:putative endonuclease